MDGKMLERVDALRSRVGASFSIRGIPRKEIFSTRKPLKAGRDAELPTYFVKTRYEMPSGE